MKADINADQLKKLHCGCPKGGTPEPSRGMRKHIRKMKRFGLWQAR